MSGTYKGKEESRKQYDYLKCIEELNELATVLMQQFNKPHKDLSEDVVEELGDVYYRSMSPTLTGDYLSCIESTESIL